MRTGRRTLLVFSAGCIAVPARAFPDRPVTILVGFGAGGVNDLVARSLAEAASPRLGQPVVVQNLTGAGGILAADRAAKAAPDGHTLLLVASPHAFTPGLYARLPYDAVSDFAPVAFVGPSANVLVVPAASPDRDLEGLARRARAAPAPFRTGSGALAGFQPNHQILRETLGIPLEAVPYRSGPQGLTDLVAGRLDLMVSNVLEVAEHVRGNRLRALAVTSPTRSPLLPEVPTFVELGVPALRSDSWFGLLAPRATPDPALDRLHAAFTAAMAEPALAARLRGMGLIPQPMTRAEWGRFLAEQTETWSAVPRRAGVLIE